MQSSDTPSPDNSQRDQLFEQSWPENQPFQFDESVASVFNDMIRRSIPGYETLLRLISIVAGRYAQPDTVIYDLGCSLGGVSLTLQQSLPTPGCRIIAIDQSEPMIQKLDQTLKSTNGRIPIETRCEDVTKTTFQSTSVVILNFTLQFIDPSERLACLERICAALVPGGLLVLSEKIHQESPESDEFHTKIYEEFKRTMGYSELEISRKREALENVLKTDSQQTHSARLKKAGFAEPDILFQSLCFTTMVACKL